MNFQNSLLKINFYVSEIKSHYCCGPLVQKSRDLRRLTLENLECEKDFRFSVWAARVLTGSALGKKYIKTKQSDKIPYF